MAAEATDKSRADQARADHDDSQPQGDGSGDFSSSSPTWSESWTLPSLVVSLGLIALGLWFATRVPDAFNAELELDRAHELVRSGDIEGAKTQLKGVIEPRFKELPVRSRARFHALVADWISIAQEAEGVSDLQNWREIDRLYSLATEEGMLMPAVRWSRWGHALLAMDQDAAVDRCIQRLESFGEEVTGEHDGRSLRNQLIKAAIDRALRMRRGGEERTQRLLDMLRQDPYATADDQAWAMARWADLELQAGRSESAKQALLIGIRRLEAEEGLTNDGWGELHVLLARLSMELGESEDARYYSEVALKQLRDGHGQRAEAILVLADLAVGEQLYEDAEASYGVVIEEFPNTDAALAARLGRASTRGILGLSPADIEDYSVLVDELGPGSGGSQRLVSADDVAASLADRHDAVLAQGSLDSALRYVQMAERLFTKQDVPAAILQRLASTSRQVALNMLSQWESEGESERPTVPGSSDSGIEIRRTAAELFNRAGEAFLRHTRKLAGQLDADETWAQSLWLAGDSFDRAGSRSQAIEVYREYIEGRPLEDPRRPEILYQLAQAWQADLNWTEAAALYETLVTDYPRSTWGTQSHVPLARAYRAMDRTPEAIAQLQRVLDGQYPITPEAEDYRAAMMELGRVQHDGGDFREAVGILDSLYRLNADDDPWVYECAYLLANSYRQLAQRIEEQLETTPDLRLPDDRVDLKARRISFLREARTMYLNAAEGIQALEQDKILGPAEAVMERLSWMYAGDCAFELGAYEEAIRLYDQYSRRFAAHHTSMHALIQIVNCYLKLGDTPRADMAHQQAVHRLRELPEGVFDQPDSVMNREAWEQWLRQRPVGLASPVGAGSS